MSKNQSLNWGKGVQMEKIQAYFGRITGVDRPIATAFSGHGNWERVHGDKKSLTNATVTTWLSMGKDGKLHFKLKGVDKDKNNNWMEGELISGSLEIAADDWKSNLAATKEEGISTQLVAKIREEFKNKYGKDMKFD